MPSNNGYTIQLAKLKCFQNIHQICHGKMGAHKVSHFHILRLIKKQIIKPLAVPQNGCNTLKQWVHNPVSMTISAIRTFTIHSLHLSSFLHYTGLSHAAIVLVILVARFSNVRRQQSISIISRVLPDCVDSR